MEEPASAPLVLLGTAALGVSPRLWRTPWGDTAPWTTRIASDRDLRLVGWTTDTHDWRGDSAEEMFKSTCEDLTDGAIVLHHLNQIVQVGIEALGIGLVEALLKEVRRGMSTSPWCRRLGIAVTVH